MSKPLRKTVDDTVSSGALAAYRANHCEPLSTVMPEPSPWPIAEGQRSFGAAVVAPPRTQTTVTERAARRQQAAAAHTIMPNCILAQSVIPAR